MHLTPKNKKEEKKMTEEEMIISSIVCWPESEDDKREEKEENVDFEQIFKESLKCFHIDITNYIEDRYLQNKIDYSDFLLINCIKYYNIILIQYDYIANIQTLFYYFCRYDYYLLVDYFLKTIDIDINKVTIYITILHQILITKYQLRSEIYI